MKQIYLLGTALLMYCGAQAQRFSLDDLIGYTAYTPARFENTVAKKGYRNLGFTTADDGPQFTWRDKKHVDSVEKSIAKWDGTDRATIAFQTTSEAEFALLRNELKQQGFHFADGAKTEMYQKGNLTITPVESKEDGKTVYRCRIERKALPKAKDLVFAEDFLQLTSHEYLASVFGEAAVKRDQFYFSEKEINRCSVLFPNTSMQIIFIWNDEENLRDPAFLLIGGQLQAKSSLSYHKQIEQNVWQSKQGIYSGMTLRELQRLNGNMLNINGWQSEQPGVVADKNKGTINFSNLNLVLNCLDCNEDEYYTKNEVLSSENVLREGRRVYVSSLILLPTKK